MCLDEGVLLGQACLEFLYAGGLGLNLALQVLDGLLHLGGADAAVLELLLQLGNHLAVLLHGLLDELHVLVYHLSAAGALGVAFCDGHASLSLVDASDALLHFVEGAQDVVQLDILLVDDALQGITFLLDCVLLFSGHVACAQTEDAGNE